MTHQICIQIRWKGQECAGRNRVGFGDKKENRKLGLNKTADLWFLILYSLYSIILFSPFSLYFSNLCSVLAPGLFSVLVSFSRLGRLESDLMIPQQWRSLLSRTICYPESSLWGCLPRSPSLSVLTSCSHCMWSPIHTMAYAPALQRKHWQILQQEWTLGTVC